MSLGLPWPLLPLLWPPESAQISSSLSSSIISSQFSGLMARNWHALYCRQRGCSMFAVRSALPDQEKCWPVRFTFLRLVFYWLERSTWSPKARALSHLQLFIWSRVLSNISPIYEWKGAHHSWKGDLLLLWYGHISWNCEQLQVMTGSGKFISDKRSHALSFFRPPTLYTWMSPQMCSEMNQLICLRSNDRRRCITDFAIVAPAVALSFPLCLPCDAITASWNWMYTGRISSMIQLNVTEGSTEATNKVVKVIECVLERDVLFCAGHVLPSQFSILAVGSILEEYGMEGNAGRWDIYPRVPAIFWFNLFCWLSNTKQPGQHLAEPCGTSWTKSFKKRFITLGEDNIQHWAFHCHLVSLLPLRPPASRCKLTSSLVIPAVQPSNMATNA